MLTTEYLVVRYPEEGSPRIRRRGQTMGELSPDRPALVEAAGTWNYRQLALCSRRGPRPGSSRRECVRAIGSCLRELRHSWDCYGPRRSDAWPVLVNPRLSAREIDEIRDHCGARRVLYTTSVSPHAREHARTWCGHWGAGGLGPIGIGSLNETVEPEPNRHGLCNRVGALIYTSGTTGLPKGVSC